MLEKQDAHDCCGFISKLCKEAGCKEASDFCAKAAEAVGKDGHVFAVDTNPKFLEFIKNSANEKGLDNVETVLTTEDDLTRPKKSLYLIFMRNLCHHIANRMEHFKKLKGALKPEGKIAIIEYRRGRFSFHGISGHYVPKETIIKEMKETEYQL